MFLNCEVSNRISYVYALAMAWAFNEIFSWNKSTVNEQIAEILILSSIDIFSPELQLNRELKVDGLHFSPYIANALVRCS